MGKGAGRIGLVGSMRDAHFEVGGADAGHARAEVCDFVCWPHVRVQHHGAWLDGSATW